MSAANPLPPTPRDTNVPAVRTGARYQATMAVTWLVLALVPVGSALMVRQRAAGSAWLFVLLPSLLLLALGIRCLLRRGAIATVYRHGEPAAATVKDTYFLQRRYWVLEVETGDGLRRATIVGYGRLAAGTRLQTLVYRDWVGVVVKRIGLSVGRLRR